MVKRRFRTSINCEDYNAFRALIADGDLPETFAEWLKISDDQAAKLTANDWIVEKVRIYPDEFSVWCKQSGVNCNAAALGAFTVVVANRR